MVLGANTTYELNALSTIQNPARAMGTQIQDTNNILNLPSIALSSSTNVSFANAPNSPFSVGSDPRSIAVGDFDLDGNQDLAVANNSSNDVSILLGDGTGNFGTAAGFGAGSNPKL